LFLSLVVWPPTASWAQVVAPNAAGVAMGQWHTIVRNVEATTKFWALVGGTPIKVDGVEVMKFPGVLIFMQPGALSEENGNKGSAIDHPGFNMKDGEQFLARLKTAGLKIDPIEGRGPDSGYITTPDGLRIEMQGNENDVMKRSLLGFSGMDLDVAIASDHLHYFLPESAVDEAQAWYVKHFAANALKENNRGKTPAGDLPGVRLRFGSSRTPTLLPTKGRALDYVGFEVKNLEAFCKKLEASGIKFDQAYSKSRHKSFASAELTDPWGTSIELTEGLSRF
jgi:catechol 2,3-dioxygenase-like lactoylglutathione lyase family enzyme